MKYLVVLLVLLVLFSCSKGQPKITEQQITEYENCLACKTGTPLDKNQCAYEAEIYEWMNYLLVYQVDTFAQVIVDTTEYQYYIYDNFNELQVQAQIADIVIHKDTIWIYGMPEPRLYPDSILLFATIINNEINLW